MQILCVATPHPSLSHVSGSVGRHLGCLVLILTVGEGRARDTFVIKAASGKWLFNLSSPMRIILLETGSGCNVWIFAAHFTATNSARSHQANLISGFDALLSGPTSGLKSIALDTSNSSSHFLPFGYLVTLTSVEKDATKIKHRATVLSKVKPPSHWSG